MTEERITSRKNPLLQQVRRLLSSAREREQAGLFAADGTKLLAEAVRYFPGLRTVILADGVEAELPEHVRCVRVPADVMESISPMAAPQGALFLCELPERRDFEPVPGMLLLDGIQDPGNLGTILRTADAFRVPAVIMEGCADPYSAKTVRASMGAVFRTPVIEADWQTVCEKCAAAQIPIAAAALRQDARNIRELPVGQMAVVVGSEGRGVRREILDRCGSLIIPMAPHCESLNAAAAAAVIMWQMGKV